MKKALSDVVFAAAVISIVPAAPAHAYLDGATVSIILQAITGSIASALIFGKMYWAKLKGFFKPSKSNLPD